MKIMNIHGYGGSAENSACVALKELGHDVVSPQIDYCAESPEKVFDNIREIFRENKPDYIVGTSLGGFFALLTSIHFNIPVVLVNPCLMPFITLPEVGHRGDVSGFIRLFSNFADIRQENITAIIGGQDEVISYHNTVTRKLINNCTVIPEGRHTGGTLPLKEFFGENIK
ncbi:MAG: hypothetical protein NC340_05885 [Ruminococcus flavefaciens]|nr:hypothetical protein [Ruminococcus flavefaciens]MCM1231199.1 hypothetical protein [Ruminococcus flavefaciens]